MGNTVHEKGKIGSYTLEDLQARYQEDLFDRYLPYVDQYIYDTEYGGFLCHSDLNGHHPTTHKRTWYDGRGAWVYTYLYDNLDPNPLYLERAEQTLDFLLQIKTEEYPFWPWGYTREGTPLDGNEADIYGSLFVAEGMAGMAIATGEKKYWNKAVKILNGCIDQYDNPKYEYIPHFKTAVRMKAPRVLGHWMIMLNLSSHLQEFQTSAELLAISDRCIRALLQDHLQPEFQLMVEYLQHDFTLPSPPLDQFSYPGHGIEVLWMVMDEAQRRGDQDLWKTSSGLFKRHVEVAWDEVYGGILHELTNVKNNDWLLDKVLWAQEEVLVGLMMLIETEEDPWALRWFDKVYPYVRRHFIRHDHEHKLWINGGDRKMENLHQVDRFENYHHPRHLMKNILAIERMIQRSGKTLPFKNQNG